DYTTPYPHRTRRLENTVHLETRCDGQAHGGCQAGCLLYWNLAWLKPVEESNGTTALEQKEATAVAAKCSESELLALTQKPGPNGQPPTYVCQATEVTEATTPLAWWDLRQYIEDYTSGNVGLSLIVRALIYSAYFHIMQAGVGLGPPMRWLYDKVNPLFG